MLIVYVPFSILFPNTIFIFSQIFGGFFMLDMLWFRLMVMGCESANGVSLIL